MKKRQNFSKSKLNTLALDTFGKSIQLEIPDNSWTKATSGNSKLNIKNHHTSRPQTAVSIFATQRNNHKIIPTITQTYSEKLFCQDNSHKDLITKHKIMLKKSSNCSAKYFKDSLNLSIEPEIKKKLNPSPFFSVKAKSQKKLVSYKKKISQTLNAIKNEKQNKEKSGNFSIKDLNSPDHFTNFHLPNKKPNIRYHKVLKSKNKPKINHNIPGPLVVSCIGKIQMN